MYDGSNEMNGFITCRDASNGLISEQVTFTYDSGNAHATHTLASTINCDTAYDPIYVEIYSYTNPTYEITTASFEIDVAGDAQTTGLTVYIGPSYFA